MPLQPIRPTLIRSLAGELKTEPDNPGASPRPAAVIAVFRKKTLRVAIVIPCLV
jgi:hypothetical protein